jgi:hypothetical protein
VADAIVVTRAMTASTIAEFYLEQSTVRVELEIGVRDLSALRDMLPDPLLEKLTVQPVEGAWRVTGLTLPEEQRL